jgi:hypothetical protein
MITPSLQDSKRFIEITPKIKEMLERDTDRKKLRATYQEELDIKIGFIRELLEKIEQKQFSTISILMGQELVKGETDYEIDKSKREVREAIIDDLEKEGFVENKKYFVIETEHFHEEDIYASFSLKSKDALKYLRLVLMKASKENEIKKKILKEKKKVRYEIKLTGKREIILNNKYLIKKSDSFSTNSIFFEYAYNNSGERISKKEMTRDINFTMASTKKFRNIVYELGFSGELKEMFFEVSKNYFIFNNYISVYDLKEKHININKLNDQIKKLNKIKPINKRIKKKL